MGRILRTIIPAMLAIFFFGGCYVNSYYPVCTEKDIVYDEGLEGVWKGKGDDTIWSFKKGENTSYRVFIYDETTSCEFEGHLTDIGTARFLDLFPTEPDDINDLYFAAFIPLHLIMRCERNGDELALVLPNADYFADNADSLANKGITILKDEENAFITLTTKTERLRDFFRTSLNDSLVWEKDDDILRRINNPK